MFKRALSVSISIAYTVSLGLLLILLVGCGGLARSGSTAPPPANNPQGGGGGGSNPPGGNPTPQTPTTPTDITALNHIIFMFQENRSFDHYFGHMNHYRMSQTPPWGGPNDVNTIDSPSFPGSGNPANNPADASAPVRWQSQNATSVTINGAPAGSTSGGMTVRPTTATLYSAVATSSTGLTAHASVVIGTSPDIGSNILVGASPIDVQPGGTSLLTWATTDGSNVTISPPPDAKHPQAYGPNASAFVKAPSTAGSVTYNLKSSSGLLTSITLNVAPLAAGAPFITVTNSNQGHVSNGSSATLQPFVLHDQCLEDLSPDWLESHGAFNRDDPGSNTWLGNGFIHIAAGFAQFGNSQNDPHHYYDVQGARAMGYYDENMLPFYYFLASEFATSDNWFSPIPSNTPANRLAELAATTAGYAHQAPQLPIKNIFELVDDAGISWKVYYSDVGGPNTAHPGTPLTSLTDFNWGSAHADLQHLAPVDCTNPTTPCHPGQTDYFTDLKSGNFPAVVLIEPGFDSGRDEHPGNPVQVGAVYDETLMSAFMSSPIWKDSVFFLTFDESGGLFDHVQPLPAVSPDGIAPVDLQAGKDPPGDFTRTGFRLPLMVVSPYSKPHFVSHQGADNTAILKFIEERFKLPSLTNRDKAQPDLDFFDFTKISWPTPPSLPVQPKDANCAAYTGNP